MPSLPWLKIIKVGLPVLAVALLLYTVYSKGVNSEAERQENIRQAEQLDHEQEVARLKDRIAENELYHRITSQRINDRLAEVSEEYARSIAAIEHGFALRLRESEARSEIYRDMSEAGPAERADLAGHAAELDRSLEEGRRLVGELRSTLEQRDEQVRALGEQLTADRKLISDSNTPTE